MMKHTLKFIIYLSTVIIISGCSTLRTNFEDEPRQWGNEYSGTNCAAKTTIVTMLIPYYWWYFPFSLIDTVLSFAADTVLLPFELASDNPDVDYPNCGSM